jgi:TolB protein
MYTITKKILFLVAIISLNVNASSNTIDIVVDIESRKQIQELNVAYKYDKRDAVNYHFSKLKNLRIKEIKKCSEGSDCFNIYSNYLEVNKKNKKTKIIRFNEDTKLVNYIYKSVYGVDSPFIQNISFVVKRDNKNYKIATSEYDGRRIKYHVHSTEPLLSPKISPNGHFLTYVSYSTYKPSIFIQNLYSGATIRIPFDNAIHPDWSPNSSDIVFSGYNGSNYNIYRYSLNNKNLVKMTRSKMEHEGNPSYIDKNIIAYTATGQGLPKMNFIDLENKKIERKGGKNNIYLQNIDLITKKMILLVRKYKKYALMKYDYSNGDENIVVHGSDIESPSVSNNFDFISYSKRLDGRKIINVVNEIGTTIYKIKIKNHDVYDMNWKK